VKRFYVEVVYRSYAKSFLRKGSKIEMDGLSTCRGGLSKG
jgi:hypothetical protein